MKKLGMVFVAIISLIFVGCSRADYVKPGATTQQIKSAELACQKEAVIRINGGDALSRKFARESYVIDCMEGKGIYKRWKYEEMKKKGTWGKPTRLEILEKSCYRGDTIACYQAGTEYAKQDIRIVGAVGHNKARPLFKKGCESYAPNKSAQMRAKNLCCKHYDILR